MGETSLPNCGPFELRKSDYGWVQLCSERRDGDWRCAIAAILWPKGLAICRKCGYDQTTFRCDLRRWDCRSCHQRFSVKTGTVFQSSHISITKWLAALWIVLANEDAGVTRLTRLLDLPRSSVDFMLERFRDPRASNSPTVEIKLPKYHTRKTRSSKAIWGKSLDRLRSVIAKYSTDEFANVYIETLRGLLHGQGLQLPREHAANAAFGTPIGSNAIEKKRRQRRSFAEKMAIVEEASRPGASVKLVAVVNWVTANQIYAWRKLLTNGERDDHDHNQHSEDAHQSGRPDTPESRGC